MPEEEKSGEDFRGSHLTYPKGHTTKKSGTIREPLHGARAVRAVRRASANTTHPLLECKIGGCDAKSPI